MKCCNLTIGGHGVIVCSQHRVRACSVCQEPAGFACDWKLGPHRTCSAALCEQHRHNVAKAKDLCPKHHEAWQRHPANAQGALPLEA